ncbi:hypothetical protein RYZ26_04860 [Terasakiella sp. A23]|uniref:hypothetical protein n=1 Tax=Terasakiella sp. FCG-A23 TaxID=3080561 RepID=UPI002954D696|nr:hypothetical protein [Terasakiella sp. A23]MDV7338909.1 hypothetical protein [Terasakiella sp. A23]
MELSSAELKALLAEAETKITEEMEANRSLSEENEHLNTALNDLMAAQMEEAEQIVQLTEKCWELEKALEDALQEKAQVIDLVQGMSAGLTDLKAKADQAIARAKTETSRVNLASELQNLATDTINSDLDKYLDKLAEPVQTGRE